VAAVSPLSRELVLKIVYYGPGLGGKTTTLEYLHASAKPEHRGKLVSLATPVDRTLYFDFLPLRVRTSTDLDIRLQLFTVPGQVYFNATRKLVLTGADAVVFVCDSQAARADANLESLANLRENLEEFDRDIERMPFVFQYNKQDLPELTSFDEMQATLNSFGAPAFPTCARQGTGIYDSLNEITERAVREFETSLPPHSLLAGMAQSIQPELLPAEGGLTQALRDASVTPPELDAQPPKRTKTLPEAGPPSARALPISLTRPPVTDIDTPRFAADERQASPPRSSSAPSTHPSSAHPSSAHPRTTDVPRTAHSPGPQHRRASAGLSFAELWPESERADVLFIESALCAGQRVEAIERCDGLLSRILAEAADLLGSLSDSRDSATVPLLLGLDGRRILAFRATVQRARAQEGVTAEETLAAYAFTIEARIARASVH